MGEPGSGRYHHGNLRLQVVECADRMLEESGIENLSLRDVAVKLGVSHGAPYRHFPKKIDLLFAVAERGFCALADAMEAAFKRSTPAARLQESGIRYVKLAVSHPARTQLMFSNTIQCHEAPASLQSEGNRAFRGLLNIIADGQKRGAFLKTPDAQTLALSAWSMVHGMAALVSAGQLPGRTDKEIKIILNPLLRGISAR